MSHVLDRVPVQRIEDGARAMQPGRAALVVLAAVLYTLGWSVGMVATVLVAAARAGWYGLAWAFSAVRVGWEDARARSG